MTYFIHIFLAYLLTIIYKVKVALFLLKIKRLKNSKDISHIIFVKTSTHRGNELSSPSYPKSTELLRSWNIKLIGLGDISNEEWTRSVPTPPKKWGKNNKKKSFLSWSCCATLQGGELLSGRGNNLCSCETWENNGDCVHQQLWGLLSALQGSMPECSLNSNLFSIINSKLLLALLPHSELKWIWAIDRRRSLS